MKFAINYSLEAVELLQGEQIELDLFKCPDWPDAVTAARAHCPTYAHFSYRAGRGKIYPHELDRITDMLDMSDTPYVGIHLSPCASDFDDMPADTHEAHHRQQLIDAMFADVMTVVDRFGAQRVILENLMWAPYPPYEIPRPALEPAVISDLARRTGCGFCLDLAHASITAKHFEMDQRDYVSALPVERLRELHVSGTLQQADGAWDDHYEMTPEDWSLTEWALQCINAEQWATPWVMTFEYGGHDPSWPNPTDKETILKDVPRLFALTRSVQAS